MWQPGQQVGPPQQQQQQQMMMMQMQQPPPHQQMYPHAPGQQPPPGAYAGMPQQQQQQQQQQQPPWTQGGMPPGGTPPPWAQPGMPQVGSGAPPWTQPAAAALPAAGAPAPWQLPQPQQPTPAPQQQQPTPAVPTMPPADEEYAATIKQLAGYVNKNGADFEKMIRDKQSNNPKFSFLFGGDGHEYYRWCKHAASLNLTDEQVALQVSAHLATQNMFNSGAQANGPTSQAPLVTLTDAQASEFKAVLTSLSGEKPQLRRAYSAHSFSRCTAKVTAELTDALSSTTQGRRNP
jgi:hypothetical protein